MISILSKKKKKFCSFYTAVRRTLPTFRVCVGFFLFCYFVFCILSWSEPADESVKGAKILQHGSHGNLSHHSCGQICVLERVSSTVNVIYGKPVGPERPLMFFSSEVSAAFGHFQSASQSICDRTKGGQMNSGGVEPNPRNQV